MILNFLTTNRSIINKSMLLLLILISTPLAKALADESDPIVAKVEGVAIRLSDVYQHIEDLPLGDQIDVRDQLDRFTESVIQEELLFQYGLRHWPEDEPAFRQQIKTLVLVHLLDKQVKSRIDTSDESVEAYYRAHDSAIRGERWRVHHIPLENASECTAVLPSLTSLDSFSSMARERGIDPKLAKAEGDLGYISHDQITLGFGEKLYELPLHQAHRIDNKDGCHLLWISEHIKPPLPTFEEVKDRIAALLKQQQETTLLLALIENAEHEINVERDFPSGNREDGQKRADESGDTDAAIGSHSPE